MKLGEGTIVYVKLAEGVGAQFGEAMSKLGFVIYVECFE
jgi:hypothetical protein